MVATKFNIDVHRKLFNENPKEYTLLHTAHLNPNEMDNFTNALELLNIIRAAHQRNKTLDRFGINDPVCISDLTDTLENILMEVPFGESDLKKFFRSIYKLEKFKDSFASLFDLDYYVPYGMELKMFGLTDSECDNLYKEGDETYGELYYEFIDDKLSLEEFIVKVKDYVALVKERQNELSTV